MKKLLVFGLLFYLFSVQLQAQKNNVSILFGPSAVRFLTDDVGQTKLESPIGYALGLDLARNLHTHWQLKLGIRYASWQIPRLNGPLQWPSEHDGNGGFLYDPNQYHYLIRDYKTQDAIQILPGVRWQSNATDIHWTATAEVGFSAFLKNEEGISTKMHPTAGLALGAEWSLNSKLHVFAQPGCRIIFRDSTKRNTPESHLLNLQVELGLRHSF